MGGSEELTAAMVRQPRRQPIKPVSSARGQQGAKGSAKLSRPRFSHKGDECFEGVLWVFLFPSFFFPFPLLEADCPIVSAGAASLASGGRGFNIFAVAPSYSLYPPVGRWAR